MIASEHHNRSECQGNPIRNKGHTMRRTVANRRIVGIITTTLALGIAAPAAARPFDLNSSGSFVPAGSPSMRQSVPLTPHASAGDISELGYLAIGTGGAAVALVAIGGTLAASRRHHVASATQQSTTPA
jgi:hypothetical protein